MRGKLNQSVISTKQAKLYAQISNRIYKTRTSSITIKKHSINIIETLAATVPLDTSDDIKANGRRVLARRKLKGRAELTV